MPSYDPQILQRFCDSLYKKAEVLIWRFTAAGLLSGVLIDWLILQRGTSSSLLLIFLLVFPAWVGYIYGEQRAFLLKLEAQKILVSTRIEENTRGS